MDNYPVSLARDGDSGLVICWQDGRESRYQASQLRAACPCATCREKHSAETKKVSGGSIGLPVLSAAEARPLRIEHMRPVGNYAYNIAFSDGHDSGIFTFEQLLDLANN